MTMADLALLRPLWLLAVPVLVVVALRYGFTGGLGSWRRAVDPQLLAAIERRGGVVAGFGRRLSPWLAAAIVVAAALSGPAAERADSRSWRNLDGVVLALDLSQSMLDGGSLADAEIALARLAEAAGGRQAALVVFAGDAYLASPFSSDVAALRPLLLGAGPDLVPDPGSVPTRALALARAVLDRASMVGGDVVIASDGDGVDTDTLALAQALAAEGRRVHAIFVPPVIRRPGAPEPHPAAAAELAAAGGGRFVALADADSLAADFAGHAAERLGASGYGALVWTDYGRLMLVVAMLPMLALFRRRS